MKTMKLLAFTLLLAGTMFGRAAFVPAPELEEEIQQAKTQEAQRTEPIKIGVLAPMSGVSSFWGEPYRDSILLAYEELGLTEDKVKLIFEDTGCNYAQIPLIARKLISVDKVDAILNTFDKCGYIVAPIASKARIPHINLALDDRQADGLYNFTVWDPVENTTRKLLNEMHKRGIKRISLLILKDYAMFRTEIEVKKQLKDFPEMKIVFKEEFDPSLRDFRTFVLKAKQVPTDIYLIMGYPPSQDILVKELLTQGQRSLTSLEGFDFIREGMDQLPEGTFWTAGAEQTEKFSSAFEKRFGYKCFVGPCYGYDELKLIMAAFEKNPAFPSDGLAGVTIEGSTGLTTMLPEGWTDMPTRLKVWENGKVVMKEEREGQEIGN